MAGAVSAASCHLDALAAEFPRYGFRTFRLHNHTAIAAVRHGTPSDPGVYAVITDDPDEMRAALAGDVPPDSG